MIERWNALTNQLSLSCLSRVLVGNHYMEESVMTIAAKVRTHKISSEAILCVSGSYNMVGPESPAIEAMTDFARVSAATNFTATRRSRWASRARYTAPMPPAPSRGSSW